MGEISHSGVVLKADEASGITVSLEARGEGCSSCRVAGLCSAGRDGRTVTVPYEPGYASGDSVMVRLDESLSLRAVLLAYVVPVVLVLAAVPLLSAAGAGELAAGAAALLAVAAYYLLLYVFRGRMSRSYRFRISK